MCQVVQISGQKQRVPRSNTTHGTDSQSTSESVLKSQMFFCGATDEALLAVRCTSFASIKGGFSRAAVHGVDSLSRYTTERELMAKGN